MKYHRYLHMFFRRLMRGLLLMFDHPQLIRQNRDDRQMDLFNNPNALASDPIGLIVCAIRYNRGKRTNVSEQHHR